MHIWLVTGYAGSGKDTFARFLCEQLNIVSTASISSFASAVKDAVSVKFGISRETLDTQDGKSRWITLEDGSVCKVRDLLIAHGEGEKHRVGKNGVWVTCLSPPTTEHWILSDWRFPEERHVLQERFPAATIHTVRIVRPYIEILESYTEHALSQVLCKHIIENTGSLLYLANQAVQLALAKR
jgi:hypothetical protein